MAMLNDQRVNLHFPMAFLWFSYGFPMIFLYQMGSNGSNGAQGDFQLLGDPLIGIDWDS